MKRFRERVKLGWRGGKNRGKGGSCTNSFCRDLIVVVVCCCLFVVCLLFVVVVCCCLLLLLLLLFVVLTPPLTAFQICFPASATTELFQFSCFPSIIISSSYHPPFVFYFSFFQVINHFPYKVKIAMLFVRFQLISYQVQITNSLQQLTQSSNAVRALLLRLCAVSNDRPHCLFKHGDGRAKLADAVPIFGKLISALVELVQHFGRVRVP